MRYKIAKIRISRNMYDGVERPAESLLAKKRLYNFALKASGFRTARLFTDLTTFIKLCGKVPPGPESAELMTHPGSDPGGEEARLLESYWPSQLSYKAILISYEGL
jgi:hypothetical protein